MTDIVWRRDLAGLPEPRFLYQTPDWFRAFVGGLAGFAVLAGGARLVADGIAWTFEPVGWAMAVVAIGGGVTVWIAAKPGDRREWINLAATPDGLYLPGRDRRVVFVAWAEVVDIAVERWPGVERRGNRIKFTLRLSETTWTRFSPFAAVAGRGPVRTYTLPSIDVTGDHVAEQLNAYRTGERAPANR